MKDLRQQLGLKSLLQMLLKWFVNKCLISIVYPVPRPVTAHQLMFRKSFLNTFTLSSSRFLGLAIFHCPVVQTYRKCTIILFSSPQTTSWIIKDSRWEWFPCCWFSWILLNATSREKESIYQMKVFPEYIKMHCFWGTNVCPWGGRHLYYS